MRSPAISCLSGVDYCSCRIAGSVVKFTDADGKMAVYKIAEWNGEHNGWVAAWPD